MIGSRCVVKMFISAPKELDLSYCGGEALGVRRLDAALITLECDQLTPKRRRQAAALQGALRAQGSSLIVGDWYIMRFQR
jgi:hypothetical protein